MAFEMGTMPRTSMRGARRPASGLPAQPEQKSALATDFSSGF
jgi:hypothetical protein